MQTSFSVGAAVTDAVRTAIVACADWLPAIEADRNLGDGAQIAELTHLLDLSALPSIRVCLMNTAYCGGAATEDNAFASWTGRGITPARCSRAGWCWTWT